MIDKEDVLNAKKIYRVSDPEKYKYCTDYAGAATKEIYRIQQTQPTPQVTYYVQAPDLTSRVVIVVPGNFPRGLFFCKNFYKIC